MSNYTTIRSAKELAKELQAGHHISWLTEAMSGTHQHHAIVVAYKGENSFKIMHVNDAKKDASPRSEVSPESSGSSGSGNPHLCEVVEELVDLREKICKGKLRRYDYDPKHCTEAAEIIDRARSKLGPFDYDCEHFVRLCIEQVEESQPRLTFLGF